MKINNLGQISILIFVILLAFISADTLASEDSVLFKRAHQAAKDGNEEFAFMNYRAIFNNKKNTKYDEKALFAIGEYFFFIPSYQQSEKLFNRFLKEYPLSKTRLFVLAHLYRISQEKEDNDWTEKLKTEIVNYQRVSFVFKKKEEYRYKSPLGRNYSAFIHIDKIEFYVEGELFAKIIY